MTGYILSLLAGNPVQSIAAVVTAAAAVVGVLLLNRMVRRDAERHGYIEPRKPRGYIPRHRRRETPQ